MKIKIPSAFLFCAVGLSLVLLVSCGPIVVVVVTPTPLPVTTTPSPFPITETPFCPPENWPCPSDSLTLTAEGATLAVVTPSFTPPAGVTVVPAPGDLGWGAVYGKILDGVTNLPIEGATVRCEHSSYNPVSPCKGIAITNADGIYSFVPVFFHDTDRITLLVEAPGYTSLRFEQPFFTQPTLHADLSLFPPTGDTPIPPTPIIMCTAPSCPGGDLTCIDPNGCPGGCGTICLTATP